MGALSKFVLVCYLTSDVLGSLRTVHSHIEEAYDKVKERREMKCSVYNYSQQKKQPIVALSTTEAEYIAATHTAKEALWLCTFIAEIAHLLEKPITIYLDNISTISITKNDEYHPRMKHINICHHFIYHAVREGLIHVDYVPTDDTAADMFMKALPRHKVLHLNAMVGLRSA